jgi:two-component system, chemotaxis family, protein-glutamate methylesterase/glutaminase
MAAPANAPVTVAVVEGSRVQRALLRRVLEADGDLKVVGEAATAEEAVALVRLARPKVVTLDLQIAGGGLDAIASLMRVRPVPILVFSVAVDGAWSDRAVDALAAGATEVLAKPTRWDKAAESRVRDRVRAIAGLRPARSPVTPPAPAPAGPARTSARAVALAASTGGPAALAVVLGHLAGVPAPVLVVQHLHADFTDGFVDWLARTSAIPVQPARHGERLKPGVAYVGPGDVHLRLGPGLTAVLDPKPDGIHRPSANELFASMAAGVGAGGVGVLLTGMGADGAEGLAAMRQAGALTIAQDEETSVVFGMPGAAVKAGAAARVLPLPEIPAAVLTALARPVRRP